MVEKADEKDELAAELERIRDTVRDRALMNPEPRRVLPEALAPRTPEPMPPLPETPPARPVPPPDSSWLQAAWSILPERPGLLHRLVQRFLGPVLEKQQALNARQVQFDHEVIAYLHARLEETHRHYDSILGIHSRHMAEIDERHLILQEELVAHVHDLVKRIDLVLAEAERGRLSLEFALQDLRARLVRLQAQLGRG